MKLATDLVHAGRDDLGTLGVHALPIDLSNTYPVTDLATGTAQLQCPGRRRGQRGESDLCAPVQPDRGVLREGNGLT